jgi:ABC-type nitrate/sulfonate/bicarbonate transport system permease component
MRANASLEATATRASTLWRESVGIIGLLVLWELLAASWLAPRHLAPTPISVLTTLWHHPNLALWPNAQRTIEEAAVGWLGGNALGILLAVVFVQVPVAETALLRVALASYCMPVIAIAPILDVVLSGLAPAAVIAALSVVFTTLIGTLVGLRSADSASLDLVRAYGGGSFSQLIKIRVPASLPMVFAALRIAGPAAVLGAVVGEYLGGSNGLGVAMVNTEQGLEISETWMLAAVTTAIAGIAYLAAGAVARIAVPWATGTELTLFSARDRQPIGLVARTLRSVADSVVSVAVIIGLWQAFITVLHLNPFFAKGPVDVWEYLVSSSQAGSNWHQLLTGLAITARDAGFGYVAGTVLASATSVVLVLSSTVERTVMPVAMILRSVPLVALAPVLILLFGQGLIAVIVIAGIVTFFPTLVNLVFGLRSAPSSAVDLALSYGASPITVLRKIRIPCALPSLFASARIAAPAAMLGAVIAEWLATGRGLGYEMLEASNASEFDFLWSGVVLITALAFLVYHLVASAERLILVRYWKG